MKTTKSEIRTIALELLFNTPEPPTNKDRLDAAILEALRDRTSHDHDQDKEGTHEYDWTMFEEMFWDLIIDRIIMPGTDAVNPALPHFRIRSDARENLKRLAKV
jgi:hypothetical protein